MAINFKKVAEETILLSPIMAGKEKLSTDDVAGRVLTIIAFDFAPKFTKEGTPIVDESTGEVDTFGVVVFQEIPNAYYCVGTVFTKVCKAWCESYESPQDASKDLEEQGGVKVKFSMGHTKNGNNLVSVDFVI